MAKGFSPLIGLAVVVALAMVAVFGAMSLTNPAFAQSEPAAIEGLMVTSVGDGSINLSWDFVEDHIADSYQVRWAEAIDPVSSGTFVDTSNVNLTITPGTATTSVVAVIMSLNNGARYNVQVRSTLYGAGDEVTVMATPDEIPDGTTFIVSATPEEDMPGKAMLTWTYLDGTVVPAAEVTGWEYRTTEIGPGPLPDVTDDDIAVPDSMSDWTALSMVTGEDGTALDPFKATVSGLEGNRYHFRVRALNGEAMQTGSAAFVNTAVTNVATVMAAPADPVDPTITAISEDPGKNTRYTIKFTAGGGVEAGTQELVIELEDFGFPASVDSDDVTIRVNRGTGSFNEPSNPQDVAVSGKKLRITLDDTNPASMDDTKEGIAADDMVTITIAQAAGLSNPTEGGGYPAVITGGTLTKVTTAELMVPRIIGLDENDGGRGDIITVTGKGFKNGHTMTFWLDRNMNNLRDEANEAVLCDADVMDNDTASCTFDVSNPPFTGGVGGMYQMLDDDADDAKCDVDSATLDCNFINGSDGIGNYPSETIIIPTDSDDPIIRDQGHGQRPDL